MAATEVLQNNKASSQFWPDALKKQGPKISGFEGPVNHQPVGDALYRRTNSIVRHDQRS